MTVVVEPVLTEEKLRSLLAEGHEQPALDYKSRLDLGQRRDTVEFAKDVAAMQGEAAGGYIVVGADDHGKVVASLTAGHAALFDEARLRGKLQRYIAEPFDIRSTVHQVNGQNVALVYVAASPEGWCIFKQDGEHEDPPGSGRIKTVFRVGEVFVRRGTASQRWDDTDRKRLVEQIVTLRKDTWRTELRQELVATMNVGLSAQRLEQLPTSAVTWQLDAAGFDELVVELMRRDDDIPLRRLLLRAPADAGSLLTSDLDGLATVLDRVASVGAMALIYERPTWFAQAVDSLAKIYGLGFDASGVQRRDGEVARVWLQVIARVYGLGGLAVRSGNWDAVRKLAGRRPQGLDSRHYTSWLRHSLTMAARAGILDEERNAGLIARAHNVVREVAALHPDVDANSEEVLNSLCQFDALGALVIMTERGELGGYYPSFCRYYSHRTEPAFVTVIRNGSARKAVFPGDDDFLAAAIRHIDSIAQREGFNYDGWEGFDDPTVRWFLEIHSAPSAT